MNNNSNLTPIFIGGTGRSGTTILSKYIGSNKAVVKVPFESRFMLDKDGLIDLYGALAHNYSMDQGRIAIRSFRNKIITEMANPYKSPYLGWSNKNVTSDILINATNKLIDNISAGKFKGVDYSSPDSSNYIHHFRKAFANKQNIVVRLSKKLLGQKTAFLKPSIKNLEQEEIYIPLFFKDEENLLKHLRCFVNDVFFNIYETQQNADYWCEDTPANILNKSFLEKMYPQAKFIHVMRHPVGVAHSMRKMVWAPDSLEQCCDLLENLYEKLIQIHEENSSNNNYYFIKLEDLEDDNNKELLNSYLNINTSDYSNDIKIEAEKMNYFIKKMDKSDFRYASSRLSHAIEFFGYA